MKNSPPTRLNNFDALRFTAAVLVLVSHQFALTGVPEPVVFGSISLGTFAVMVFFSISGFLVSQSWRQDPNIGRFLIKRFLRIWPGLAIFTLLAAFFLGPLVTTLTIQEYFKNPELLEFFENLKLATIRHNLPGVFETNTFPKAVNGSLWTIPIEVRCYLVLLLLGIFGFAKKPALAFISILLFGVYYFAFNPDPKNYQLHYALFFFTGACLDIFRREWESRPSTSVLVISIFISAFYLIDAPRVALLIFITFFSIFLGSRSTPALNRFGRYGDLSYGIYVYAFAVQQTVMWVVGKNYPFLTGLLITIGITVFCAFLSWHLVEGPALQLKKRLRTAT